MRVHAVAMYQGTSLRSSSSRMTVGHRFNNNGRCSRAVVQHQARHLIKQQQQQHGRDGSRPISRVHVSPEDAQFATQQLQGILAEIRANPALSPLLDDSKLAAAIKEVAANPAALQKHASNPKVMRVLQSLLGQGLARREATAFEEAGTNPAALFTAIATDAELSKLLNDPTVRTALAQIRTNPAAGMARWGSEPLVSRAIDLLESALGSAQVQAGGPGALVDVAAEEVELKQQQQHAHFAGQPTAAPGSVKLRKWGRIFR